MGNPGPKTKRTGPLFKQSPTQKTAKAALKTRSVTAKTAERAKKKAAQTARKEAAKRAAQIAKVTTKTIKRAVKIAVATAAKMISLVTTGIGVAVALIVIIVIVAAIAAVVSSPFGIFYSDQDQSADTTAISQVAQDMEGQLDAHIDTIIQNHSYVDSVEMHYTGGDNWHDILAVFAVKTITDQQNGADVVTIDYTRIDLLSAVYWDMVNVDYHVESIHHPGSDEDDPGWTEYILHITVTRRSAAEQAETYSFTEDQKSILQELLSGAYDEYFDMLLSGSGQAGNGGTGNGGSYPPENITIIETDIYIWPLSVSQYITSYFGGRPNPTTGKPDNHTGIDIAAGYGTPVLAAADGTVITAKYDADGYGIYTIIDHGGGNHTLYGHMSSRAVGTGATVSQGDVIGYVGSTGWSTGNHLHFETRVNGIKVDPLDYFSGY